MGGAFTGIADDVSALYWNPAGLSWIKNAELGLAYDKWFMDTYVSQVIAAVPLPAGVLGADVVYMNLGSYQGRDPSGVLTDKTISPYDMAGSLGYGIKLSEIFSAGLSLKIINQSTGTLTSAGYAADLGLLFKSGIFSAGIDVRNIGSGGSYATPMKIDAGFAVRPLDSMQNRLILAVDAGYLLKDAPTAGAGAEYVINGVFAVRAGYNLRLGENNPDGFSGISAGAGLILGNFMFDYAFVPYGDLGITHRATLIYAFDSGAGEARTTAAPAAQEQPKADTSALIAESQKLEKNGDLKRAAEKMREAALVDQNNADLWKKLGMIYYKDKKKDAALKCFEKYIKLNPADKKFGEWMRKYGK
jgi:hypothetical protein